MKQLCALLILLSSGPVWAKGRHEFGVFTGPFLISNASENLHAMGGRFAYAVNSNHIGHLELQGFTSTSESGATYHLGELSIRNEFEVDKISAVWLLGFDWHYYNSVRNPEYRQKRGWHVGAGINMEIGKNLMFRNDYVLRFANGMSLLVTIGFAWAFGESPKAGNRGVASSP